jgi:hypothetical protein
MCPRNAPTEDPSKSVGRSRRRNRKKWRGAGWERPRAEKQRGLGRPRAGKTSAGWGARAQEKTVHGTDALGTHTDIASASIRNGNG